MPRLTLIQDISPTGSMVYWVYSLLYGDLVLAVRSLYTVWGNSNPLENVTTIR
ncbi:MAG: hypothetical protein HC795_02375 [Coleofasciculaceae cyanobacterium RL_1_1]|nr:hypothetical protein [Coleofasciculaceae cyanobacterium RL_1_1]